MIAVDAMGGDFAPQAIVCGALRAAQQGIAIQLYGNKVQIEKILDQFYKAWKTLPLTCIDCHQIIDMADEPTSSVVQKKDSSLVRAVKAVAEGRAKAVVSAGNSGAALVAGMLLLGKVPGILRPAIGDFLPTRSGSVFCVDLGANIDCKVEYIRQFAVMGHAYVNLIKGIERPRIALLANGAEETKGSRLVFEAHQLLKQSSLNFIGNCEPTDLFDDKADVIVSDGYTGNIMLKSLEATARIVTQWIQDECKKSWLKKAYGILGMPIFKTLKKKIATAQKGGALLLGVKKPLIIAHGASNEKAIENAIKYSAQIIEQDFVTRFNASIESCLRDNEIITSQRTNNLHTQSTT